MHPREGRDEESDEPDEPSELDRYREGLSQIMNVAWTQRFSKSTGEVTIETDYAVCVFHADGRFKRICPEPASRGSTPL